MLMSDIAKSVGQRIRNYRTQLGWSQEKLAELSGCHPTYIGQLERGEKNATLESIEKIASAMNIPLSKLFEKLGGKDSTEKDIPLKCYDFLSAKTKEEQEQLYRILLETDKYKNNCKWCYADGTYTYSNMDDLINVCVGHMVTEEFSEEQAREYLKQLLPQLDYWKRYEELADDGQFEIFKQQLIDEINELAIEGMPKLEKLNALVGKYVNLEYPLPNGKLVKFLDDKTTYLGNQLESEIVDGLCFGILANMNFIMICTYESDGQNPELLVYKKR